MSLVTIVEVLLAVAIVFGIGVAATSALGTSEVVADELPPALPPVGEADLTAEDVARVRLPLAARGYRMADVDEVLHRLELELADRDAELARLRAAQAGEHRPERAPDEPQQQAGATQAPEEAQEPPEAPWEPIQQTQLYPEAEHPLTPDQPLIPEQEI